MIEAFLKEHGEYYQDKYFKDLTFKTTIPRNVRVAEAPSHGVPVGDYDKFSKGARAYREFTKEVEARIK